MKLPNFSRPGFCKSKGIDAFLRLQIDHVHVDDCNDSLMYFWNYICIMSMLAITIGDDQLRYSPWIPQ